MDPPPLPGPLWSAAPARRGHQPDTSLPKPDKARHNDDHVTQSWRRGRRGHPDVLSRGAFSMSPPLLRQTSEPDRAALFDGLSKPVWRIFGAEDPFPVASRSNSNRETSLRSCWSVQIQRGWSFQTIGEMLQLCFCQADMRRCPPCLMGGGGHHDRTEAGSVPPGHPHSRPRMTPIPSYLSRTPLLGGHTANKAC